MFGNEDDIKKFDCGSKDTNLKLQFWQNTCIITTKPKKKKSSSMVSSNQHAKHQRGQL